MENTISKTNKISIIAIAMALFIFGFLLGGLSSFPSDPTRKPKSNFHLYSPVTRCFTTGYGGMETETIFLSAISFNEDGSENVTPADTHFYEEIEKRNCDDLVKRELMSPIISK